MIRSCKTSNGKRAIQDLFWNALIYQKKPPLQANRNIIQFRLNENNVYNIMQAGNISFQSREYHHVVKRTPSFPVNTEYWKGRIQHTRIQYKQNSINYILDGSKYSKSDCTSKGDLRFLKRYYFSSPIQNQKHQELSKNKTPEIIKEMEAMKLEADKIIKSPQNYTTNTKNTTTNSYINSYINTVTKESISSSTSSSTAVFQDSISEASVSTVQKSTIKHTAEVVKSQTTTKFEHWKEMERRKLDEEFPAEKKIYFEKIIKSTSNLLSRTGSPARRLYTFYQRSILQKHGGSAKLVQQLVDKLKLPRSEHRIDYERELAKITEKAVTTENNEIIVFHRGDLLFEDLWERMNEAKECILMETYTLGPDYTGERTMQALIDARKRGVEVVLMVDAFGSFSLKSHHFNRLVDAGVVVRRFNPISLSTFSPKHMMTRNHRKQCIIDWKYSYVGGMNIEDKYSHLGDLSKLFRDTHCRIRGPFVKQVIVSFLESFEYALHGIDFHRSKLHAQEENLRILQFLRVGLLKNSEIIEEKMNHLVPLGHFEKPFPLERLPTNLYGSTGVDICFASSHPRAGRRILQACLVNYLDAAQETICICTPYFFPSRPLKRALYRAASRGVKITILTCKKSDVPMMKYAANHLYQNLVMKHGITIYEYEKNILHAKYLVIDSCITSVGSYNFDEVSYFSNLELFLAIYSREIGEKTMKQFEEDLKNSHLITHKWIQDQPTFFLHLHAFAATLLRLGSKLFKK